MIKTDYSSSVFPIPSNSRHAGPLTMFWLYAGGNVLLASFMVGSSYSESLGLIPTILVTIFGNLAAYTVCAWSAQKNIKYGLDEAISHRPAFGFHGSLFGVVLIVGITIGWAGILSSLMGSAGELSVSVVTGGGGFVGEYATYAIIGGIVIPLILLLIDPKMGFKLSNITVPIMLILSLYMLIKLLNAENLSAMAAVEPTHETGWAYAFEVIFSFAVVWLPYLGAWNRMSKFERGGYWGTYLGLALVGMLFGIIGGMATLLTGELDPTQWMLKLDLSIAAFIGIIVGTITTITILLYSGIMAVLSVFPKWKFNIVAVLMALPAVAFVFVGTLRDVFDYILIFGGMLAGPYWAIIMVDYFFLRKEKINVKACFDKDGPYKYFKGFNPVALLGQIVGMIVWLILGGWMTGFSFITSSFGMNVFNSISATLPAMIISGIVYYYATKLLLTKYKFGDYSS